MWDFILNPMVTLLTLTYQIFSNDIVLAIVVLTFIIRMMMYPLLAKQRQSTKAMQEIKPKMDKLQEKYKDDREKLTQAQMELYKEAGVNPFGGCLPLFIQFPIFIALYNAIFLALSATPVQLVDLSERLLLPGLDSLIPLQNTWLGMSLVASPSPPDNPVYALALPAIVMVTTWIQFKFSQPGGDDDDKDEDKDDSKEDDNSMQNQAQAMTQSMGTFMPIFFGFIALSLSVGLSIYFITSNIVGIIQYSPLGDRYLAPLFGVDDKSDDEDDEKDKKKSKKRRKGKST
jgi:YidC/Oxa1 family membrane protein insertase